MENNGNQNLAASLCSSGCGFFGSPQFDGMCSKCYKESVKRKQAAPADSAPSSSSMSGTTTGITQPVVITATTTIQDMPDTTPSVETASPTVLALPSLKGEASGADSGTSGGEDTDGSETPSKTKKRNRCFTCKKKVGLTGFECRCGGLYCSIHRYSDKHQCEFDYKEHGAVHIRKNNPVVVGEKVQKL